MADEIERLRIELNAAHLLIGMIASINLDVVKRAKAMETEMSDRRSDTTSLVSEELRQSLKREGFQVTGEWPSEVCGVTEATKMIGGIEVSTTVCLDDPPWDHDAALKVRLEDAGWRYAILIGITDPKPDENMPMAMLREADAKKYAHFVKRHEGQPLWDGNDATTFVCDITGASRAVSSAWLNYDWNGGGEWRAETHEAAATHCLLLLAEG